MNDGMYSHSMILSILISEQIKKSLFKIFSLLVEEQDIVHLTYQKVFRMDSLDHMIPKKIEGNLIKLELRAGEYWKHFITILLKHDYSLKISKKNSCEKVSSMNELKQGIYR